MEPRLVHPAWRSFLQHWFWITVFTVAGSVSLWMRLDGSLNLTWDAELPGPLANWPIERMILLTPWVLAGLTGLAMVARWYSTQYRLYEERVVRHNGIIARHQLGLRYQDIRFVEVSQSIPDRILRVGDVLLYSAGTAKPEVTLSRVGNPTGLRDWIRSRIDG